MNNENNEPIETLMSNNTEAKPVPTIEPTLNPVPTAEPMPTMEPTINPIPTVEPIPTIEPTINPVPTVEPMPTIEPTINPIPTVEPMPTMEPTINPVPTAEPMPTIEPTINPVPTIEPMPTIEPTITPSPISDSVKSLYDNQNDNPYEITPVEVTQKNKLKLPIIIGVIVLVVAILAFLAFKLINNPQRTFSTNISMATKMITNKITNNTIEGNINDIKVNLKTNNETYKNFADYTFGIRGGIDSEQKKIEGKIYLIDGNKNEYSYTGYVVNSKIYSMLSSYDKLIDYQFLEEDELESLFNSFRKTKTDDINYLITFASNSLIKNLDKKNLSQKIEKIKVNNKKITAIKNTYIMSNKEKGRLIKAIAQDILDDEKACKIYGNMTNMDKKEIKEMISEYDDIYKQEDVNYISIYTNFFGKTIGIENKDKDGYLESYYKNKEEFEITTKDYSGTRKISAVKKDKLEITISNDDKTIATARVNKNEENEKSIEYNLIESNLKGTINYTNKLNNKKQVYTITANDKTNKYELTITREKEENAKIANIDEKQAVVLSDEELEKVAEEFTKSLEKTPIGEIFNRSSENDMIYETY